MKIIYNTLPISIMLVIIGYFVAIANTGNSWRYLGMGLIIGAIVLTLAVGIWQTVIYWRRDKSSRDKKLSEASLFLIFNAVVALLLFAFVTWNDIVILNDSNMFLLLWMAINLGALRQIWVPKETESTPVIQTEGVKEKKEEAV